MNNLTVSRKAWTQCPVLIIHDDSHTCEVLSSLLRLEGFPTFTATNFAQVEAALRNLPKVILATTMIGKVPVGDELAKSSQSIRGAILIGMHPPGRTAGIVAMVRAGALDVLAMPMDAEQLLSFVKRSIREDKHTKLAEDGVVQIGGFHDLTPRESQVLHLVTSSYSNKAAAHELGISPRTIEVHRARLMKKLGARNTAELLRIALGH